MAVDMEGWSVEKKSYYQQWIGCYNTWQNMKNTRETYEKEREEYLTMQFDLKDVCGNLDTVSTLLNRISNKITNNMNGNAALEITKKIEDENQVINEIKSVLSTYENNIRKKIEKLNDSIKSVRNNEKVAENDTTKYYNLYINAQ